MHYWYLWVLAYFGMIVFTYLLFNIEDKGHWYHNYNDLRQNKGFRKSNWCFAIVWPLSLPFYLFSKIGWVFRTVWGAIDRTFGKIEDFIVKLIVRKTRKEKEEEESRLSNN